MTTQPMTRATSKAIAKGLDLILEAFACQELPDDAPEDYAPLNEILTVPPDQLERAMEIAEHWKNKGAPEAVTAVMKAALPAMLAEIANRGGSGTITTD